MKILVLAGGADQIALIDELHKRGHFCILVDYFQNPPAKKYADKHIVASTLDIDRVEQIAKDEEVDLICTACTDQALLTVAKVSEQLKLPCYLSYQTGLNVTNKSFMKKVLIENNIPTAKYVILDRIDLAAIKNFNFPLVVKPVDCNSSKGVKKIDSQESLELFLKEAIQLSRTKQAIVEEFKNGVEISADFYVEKDQAKLLSATKSGKIPNKKSFTILYSDYPSINTEQEQKITDIANSIVKSFSLKNCPLLIQFIVNNDEINVIEFSARMGGGSKYNLIHVLSNINIMSKYVDRILGEEPHINPQKNVNFARMVYVYCQPGIINRIEGFNSLLEEKIIKDAFIYKTEGMEIAHAETSSDRAAGYLVVANSKEELLEKLKLADNRIKVYSQDGTDIMIHGLSTTI